MLQSSTAPCTRPPRIPFSANSFMDTPPASPATFLARTHRRPILRKRGTGMPFAGLRGASLQAFRRRSAVFWARVCGLFGAGLLKCCRPAPGIGLWERTMAPVCKVLADLRHGRATHQAFSAVFAYRLARSCHSSSVFGRFCLSSGSGEPPCLHMA